MNSILITNITANDVVRKKIRITVDNKPLFPSESIGNPHKYNLTFNHNNKAYNATYTIGSLDGKSRSGVLMIGDELYSNQLNIEEGSTLTITRIGSQSYEIDRY